MTRPRPPRRPSNAPRPSAAPARPAPGGSPADPCATIAETVGGRLQRNGVAVIYGATGSFCQRACELIPF